MPEESKKNWRYRGYDYLDQCPWCDGALENGWTRSPRGSFWIPNGGTIVKSLFNRKKYLNIQVAQHCSSYNKTLLLGTKRSFMNFMEEEPPAIRAKFERKNKED